MNTVFIIFTFLFVTFSDTLSSAYADSWKGMEGYGEGNVIMQILASNDLIFVVLGVSLIIWFVLVFYLFRLEKKLDRLEQRQTIKTPEE